MGAAENLIFDVITEFNFLEVKREARFKGLVGSGGGNLRFDFWIKTNNRKIIIVEYDGEQHFHPVRWNEKQPEWSVVHDHHTRKSYDKIKTQFCSGKGIYLIRVPYFVPWDNLAEYVRYQIETALIYIGENDES